MDMQLCDHDEIMGMCELCEMQEEIDRLKAEVSGEKIRGDEWKRRLRLVRDNIREVEWLHFEGDFPEAREWFTD